jgi:hypothetical protein
MTLLELTACAQAVYYAVTGIWPWVHMRSFLAVTGPKVDLWLVKTFGLLVVAVAVPLFTAGVGHRVTRDIVYLGVATAAGLGFADTWFSLRGVIWKTYLIDAMVEVGLIGLWVVASTRA